MTSGAKPKLPMPRTSLLDLDSPVPSLIAEKGIHRELRGTCKDLQQICDGCRTRLVIKDLPSAGNSLSSLSQWPRLTDLCLSPDPLRESSYSSGRTIWPNVLLAEVAGRQLRCLELDLVEGVAIDGGLLASCLKQCWATLETLKLSCFGITRAWRDCDFGLQNREVKSLHIFDVSDCRARPFWSPELASGTLGSHLQELHLGLYDAHNGSLVAQEWQEAGKNLKNLTALSLVGCYSRYAEDVLGGILAGCTQLRELPIEWREDWEDLEEDTEADIA